MYENKNIAVVGMARSGIACAEYLKELGADVAVYDKATFDKVMDTAISLMDKGITVYCGTNEIELEETDLIVVSPGVPPSTSFFEEAKEFGIEVISEIELSYRLAKCPIVAVTGTNGKSTTTNLLSHIFKYNNKKLFVQ